MLAVWLGTLSRPLVTHSILLNKYSPFRSCSFVVESMNVYSMFLYTWWLNKKGLAYPEKTKLSLHYCFFLNADKQKHVEISYMSACRRSKCTNQLTDLEPKIHDWCFISLQMTQNMLAQSFLCEFTPTAGAQPSNTSSTALAITVCYYKHHPQANLVLWK